MFGGWGLRSDGLFFAIVADDALYLKADDLTRPRFEEAGLHPFRPHPDRPTAMPYYPPPDEAMDGPEALLPWARLALEAARRAGPRPSRSRKARVRSTAAGPSAP
jgi:DNA transformation protein